MIDRPRVLLTGGTGFIGRLAVAALARRGATVHMVGRTAPVDSDATHHHLDLMDLGAIESVIKNIAATHLLHLAWNTAPGTYWTATNNLKWVSSSLELVTAFYEAGGRRATIAGTCAEYDWSRHTLSDTLTPLNPDSLYGRAKVQLSVLLEAGAFPELSLAWGRVFYPFGPGEKPGRLVSDTVRSILAEQFVPCSLGNQARDFMHAADVAEAFVALLFSSVEGGVNIASGNCRTVRSVVEDFAQEMGRPDLPQFGAKAQPENDPPYMGATVERLRNEVGFRPKYDWADAIRDTIEWWRCKL